MRGQERLSRREKRIPRMHGTSADIRGRIDITLRRRVVDWVGISNTIQFFKKESADSTP